jgi:hypothetical protein
MTLLSWQFLKLVLIASAVGLPLTWYGLNEWLSGFGGRFVHSPDHHSYGYRDHNRWTTDFSGRYANPAKILRTE